MTAPHISIEALRRDGRVFPMSTISIDEPPVSFTSYDADLRRVYLLGWRDDVRGLWVADADTTISTDAVRLLKSVTLTLLSDLTEPYEMTVRTRKGPRRVRFTAHPE